jgi:hypothetical protein
VGQSCHVDVDCMPNNCVGFKCQAP